MVWGRATPSAGRCATDCCPAGTPVGRCPSPMPPARSSRAGCPAPTPCRPSRKSTPSWTRCPVPSEKLSRIVSARVGDPGAIAAAAARRGKATSILGEHGKAMIIAADHPARGANGVGADPYAMADRSELLDRLCVALERPGVTGVLATADILEDLLLLGVLDGRSVFGSMNRAGLAGSVFEVDDRFTGYDAATIAAMGFDGGKMLTRIDLQDPATAATLEACSRAIDELAARRLVAMVEPFMATRIDGRLRTLL